MLQPKYSLEPFDPEIERTLLRRRRENQTRFQVAETLQDQEEEKMTDQVPLNDQTTDVVFSTGI